MKIETKDFKEKLNQLQDDVDSKEAHIALLESEIQDAVTPSNLIIDIKSTLMDMMFEITQFERSKGFTEKSIAGKKRIEGLLDKVDNLNKSIYMSHALKSSNRTIYANYQMLRVENAELKKELQKIADAEAFLAGN